MKISSAAVLLLVIINALGIVNPSLAQNASPDTSIESTPEASTPQVTAEAENIGALPAPLRTAEAQGVTVDYYFERIKQGRMGLLHLDGDFQDIEVILFGKQQPVFQVEGNDGYFVLLVVDMDQTVRTYDMTYRITRNGQVQELSDRLRVANGQFIQQAVVLPEDRLQLIDPEVETTELARIFELAAPNDDDILWDNAGFVPPMQTELTSPFGAVRVFNDTFNTRHTGWDFQASIGQPIATSASGEVIFAGQLPIRGNYVLIHHGQGLYSGYAHLSVIHVTQGQSVISGQFIGQVGSTGRSSSAHAHVEFIANGHWVDAADVILMPLPVPSS